MSIELQVKVKSGWITKSNLEIFKFPGGEPHIRDFQPKELSGGVLAQIATVTQPDMGDLFTLALWADITRERGEQVWISMPYLPFARADRGAPFGAEIFANFMNDIVRPDKILALDPHSPVIEEKLFNLTLLDLPLIVRNATVGARYSGVIAPDHGAQHRAWSVAKALKVDLFLAEKKRDFATGQLSGFGMIDELPERGRFLIVDDICDGGGTFNGLADAIQDTSDDYINLDLWVSHGIFSKGFSDLGDRFDTLYTTDSWLTGPQSGSWLKITALNTYTFGALSNA